MFKALSIGAILMMIIGAAFFFLIKTSSDKAAIQAKLLRDAAYAEGLNKGQTDTAVATNQALVAEVKRIADLQEATNDRIAGIRVEAATTREIIRTYPAETIAVTRPQEVEAWANQTTAGLFADIEKETSK